MAIARIERLVMFLESHFGDIKMATGEEDDPMLEEQKPGGEHEELKDMPGVSRIIVNVDGVEASINLLNLVRSLKCSSI